MRERYWESDEGWFYPDSLDNDDMNVIDLREDREEIVADLTKTDGSSGLRDNMIPLTSMWDDDFASSGSRFGFGDDER
jgi:hypothetical protein